MKKFKYTQLFIFFMGMICLFSFFIFPTNNSDNNFSSAYSEYLLAEDKTEYGDLIPEEHEATATAMQLSSISDIPNYYCLRDNCIIYTTDQSNFGLCWAYSMNTALSTFIQLNYKEYYDFSSAWTALTIKKYNSENGYSDYVVGGGGNKTYFENAFKTYGAMLSTDFDLTDLYSVDNNNYDTFYKIYKDYVFDLSQYNPKIVTYTSNETKNFNKTIKQHLINNGSLYASIVSSEIKNETCLYSTLSNTDHAISIIGWDDEYTAPSWGNEKGAWIALNSWGENWGNNGVFYISYKDVATNKAMYGIALGTQSQNKNISINSSSSNFKNKITHAYGNSPQRNVSSLENNIKNVFYSNEELEITYSYNLSKKPEVSIERNNKDVLISFKVATDSEETSIEGKNLESGVYKITFDFNGTKIQKSFVVLDGNELCETNLYSDSTKDVRSTNLIPDYLSNFNSYNKKQTVHDIYAKTSAFFQIYFSTYSNISNFSYTATPNLYVTILNNNFTYATENNFSKGFLFFSLKNNSNNSVETFTVTLTSIFGIDTTYVVNIYPTEYYGNNFKYVYTNIDYGGGSQVVSKEILVSTDTRTKIYLPTPTNGTSTFEGWFYSTDGENYNTMLPSDSNGYYITNSMVQNSISKNYALNSLDSNYNILSSFYYIFLKANWKTTSYTITYKYENGGGDIITEEIIVTLPCDTINFEDFYLPKKEGFEYLWSSPSSEVDVQNKVIKYLYRDIIIYGKYVLLAPELGANNINNSETSNITKTYDGQNVLLKANATHFGDGVQLNYVWEKQNDFGTFIKLSEKTNDTLVLNSAKDSGIYQCKITASISGKNESPKVTTTPFIVTINKAPTIIKTNLIEKEFTYDGQEHKIDGATINHKETDIKYNNNILKDAGVNSVTIYTHETDNYLSALEIIEVKINKAKVTIKIDNKRSAVFAQKQNYTYEIKFGTVFEGDDLKLKYQTNATTTLAGTYNISAISQNQNYDVEILDGTYIVYIEGLSLVLIIFFIAVFTALCCLLAYFLIKRKSNIKLLNSKDFDDDIRFKD